MGKPAPKYWWDIVQDASGQGCIIVQSDYPGGNELACFRVADNQPNSVGLEPQIAEAEQLIADYESGRKTPRWTTTKS